MKTYYQRKRKKKAKHHFPFIFLYTFSFYSLFGSKWIFFSYNYVQQQQERKFLLDTGSSHKNLSFFTFQTVLFIIPLFFLIFLLFFLLFYYFFVELYISLIVCSKKKSQWKTEKTQWKKMGPYFKTLFDKLSYLSKAFVWYKNRRRTKKS